jgi:hypothetical protein
MTFGACRSAPSDYLTYVRALSQRVFTFLPDTKCRVLLVRRRPEGCDVSKELLQFVCFADL